MKTYKVDQFGLCLEHARCVHCLPSTVVGFAKLWCGNEAYGAAHLGSI